MRVETDLPNVQHWTDHRGRRRARVRKYVNGVRKVLGELPVDSDPNSPEFLAAYHAIMRGERPADAVAAVTARGGSGTVNAAIERYLDSTTFRDGSSKSTQALRRPILRSVGRLVGNLPADKMDDVWVGRWLDTAPTQHVKRTRLLALKPFTAWAASPTIKLMDKDPTVGIKVSAPLKVKEFAGAHYTGHWTWSAAQIAQYCAHHALGTKARLALELMLDLASRRGDSIAVGRQHLKQIVIDGTLRTCLVYTQQKGRRTKPQTLTVPLSSELIAAIDACPSPETSLTILVNQWGRPFNARTFNEWFAEQVAAAGLPDVCTPHGLRKASACIMVETGCTAKQLMAKTGHRSLAVAQGYVDKADQPLLAAQAQAKVAAARKAASDKAEASNVTKLVYAKKAMQ
jgi:integrase